MLIANAYYIKLGRSGAWEKDSIATDKMRIGWPQVSLADINSRGWQTIGDQLSAEHSNKSVVTNDLNSLRKIVETTEADVWISFHSSLLWWCRLADGPVEEDRTSKFRRTLESWRDRDLNDRLLLANAIPGNLSQLQGFRGTVCRVNAIDSLSRLLNGESSTSFLRVTEAQKLLSQEVETCLGELHWKDFETLVDLIFRQAGWRRLSVLGESMKFADLELEEPITGERYQVQVKSEADIADLRLYRDNFSNKGFRKLFFVVHTPIGQLQHEKSTGDVELILRAKLAEMVVDAGLVSWVLAKIR